MLSIEIVSEGFVAFAPRFDPLEATCRPTESEPTDVSTAFSVLVGISDYKVLYAFVALKLPGVLYLGRSLEKSSDFFTFGELIRLDVGGSF